MTKRDSAQRSVLRLAIIAAGVLAFLIQSRPAAAECMQLDPWPPFDKAAPIADRVVVGRVVEAFDTDSGDRAIRFRLRVDEVLRGPSSTVIDFDDPVFANSPYPICPGDSILRVRVGDVLAFAFDAKLPDYPEPVTAVALVNRPPSELDQFLMPGVEQFSRVAIRRFLDLPATDTMRPRQETAGPGHALVVVAFAAIGGLLAFRRAGGNAPRDIRKR
jgi:hypothetical protein